jgi:threonine-phosphate decarboxylase
MLERYGHGGDLHTAEEKFGRRSGSFLDYSSNMNPFGPPDAVQAVIRSYSTSITQYPDPAVRHLTRQLAQRHGVSESSVLVGNGAAELIDLAVRIVRPGLTALTVPCFTEYADAVNKAGGAIVPVGLKADRDFKFDVGDIRLPGAKPDAWFLGSPNNPTGQPVDRAVIQELLDTGYDVFLDEAFMDFLSDEAERSFAETASESPNLLVIRSMTKFYAIPGIRLGYIIGRPDRIAAIRELQIPWSVNSLAQQIGAAVLGDKAYAAKTIAWLREERPLFSAKLGDLGLTVFPGAANYVLFSIPPSFGINASQLQAAMGKAGILIRDASLFAGLDSSYCRVAVKQRADNETLIAALASALNGGVSV